MAIVRGQMSGKKDKFELGDKEDKLINYKEKTYKYIHQVKYFFIRELTVYPAIREACHCYWRCGRETSNPKDTVFMLYNRYTNLPYYDTYIVICLIL